MWQHGAGPQWSRANAHSERSGVHRVPIVSETLRLLKSQSSHGLWCPALWPLLHLQHQCLSPSSLSPCPTPGLPHWHLNLYHGAGLPWSVLHNQDPGSFHWVMPGPTAVHLLCTVVWVVLRAAQAVQDTWDHVMSPVKVLSCHGGEYAGGAQKAWLVP